MADWITLYDAVRVDPMAIAECLDRARAGEPCCKRRCWDHVRPQEVVEWREDYSSMPGIDQGMLEWY